MAGPWEKYASQDRQPAGPWTKYQAPEREPSVGEQILEGVVTGARAIDSVTGAPVRAAIGAVQDDKGFGGALSAFRQQFAENPDFAPTGKEIALKAGVPDTSLNKGLTSYTSARDGITIPLKEDDAPSLAGVAGLGVDVAADITNVVPVAAITKGLVKAGAKGISKGVNIAADASDAVAKAVGKGGKRTVQGLFGVPPEAIDRYIARHPILKDKVGAREMMEELAGKLDEGLKPVRQKLAAAETAVENAKAKRSEDLAELLVKRQEAKDALKLAQDQALSEAASRVSSRVRQLDSGVKEGSSKAFNILDEEGITVPVKKLKSDMTKGIADLEARAITDEQQAVVELLKRYRERLDKYTSDIPGGEAKRLLQSLDREISRVAPGEIGRMSKGDQALAVLRRRVDEPLKSSPAYAKQMESVAGDTRLLMKSDDLASESAAARALSAASRPTGKDKAELLKELGGRFGDDYLSQVNRSNLPEYAKVKGILGRQRAVKRGEPVKAAESRLAALQSELGGAKQLTDQGLAGVTDRIQAFVRSSDPKAVQTEALLKAGDLANIKMADELADIKTISAFEKSFNRGSANTNFWAAALGGLFGSAFGPGGAILGAGGGAAFGRAIIDNFGPAVGRVLLDQAPLLKKMNPADWIRSLDIPNDAKLRLAQDLKAYVQVSRGARGVAAASKQVGERGLKQVAEKDEQNRSPAKLKGEAKWMQSGAEKLGISGKELERIKASKKGKQLLIEASDLKKDSPRLKRIKEQIQKMGNE